VPGYLRTLLFGWKRLRIQLYFGGSAEQDLLEGVERAGDVLLVHKVLLVVQGPSERAAI
jgi:hypothetical protein